MSKCSGKMLQGLPFISQRHILKLKYIAFSLFLPYLKDGAKFRGVWLTSHGCVSGCKFKQFVQGLRLSFSNFLWFLLSMISWHFPLRSRSSCSERDKGHSFPNLFRRLGQTHSAADHRYQLGGINNSLCSRRKQDWMSAHCSPFQEVTVRPREYRRVRLLAPPNTLSQQLWWTVPGTRQSDVTYRVTNTVQSSKSPEKFPL